MDDRRDPTELSDPDVALRLMDAVDRRSRATARWSAVAWLVMAVVMPLYLIGEEVVPPGPAMRIIEWTPLVVVVALFVFAVTRRSESRVAARLTGPVTVAFVALVVLCIVAKWTILSDGYSVGLLVLGLLPALPCLYGAGRVLLR